MLQHEAKASSRGVGRAPAITNLLAGWEPLTPSEVARRIDSPISTTRLVLKGLDRAEYVTLRASDKKYETGPALAGLSARVLSQSVLVTFARPAIVALTERIREDVYLGVVGSGGVSYILKSDGPHPLRAAFSLGTSRPRHATAVGKLDLAFRSRGELDDILATLKLERFTPRTITDLEVLRSELDIIRKRGFATSAEKGFVGVAATAAPVLDHRETMVGAISVSVPIERYLSASETLAAATLDTANEISRRLGSTANFQRAE